MKTPTQVKTLQLDARCCDVTLDQWNELMNGAVRANHKVIDSLVKKHLPELYEDIALKYYNPYNYFKTPKHLILVHSGIEYFLSYN